MRLREIFDLFRKSAEELNPNDVPVFLLWIYASAWIFLFGAKFTQVYANTYGTPIVPTEPGVMS